MSAHVNRNVNTGLLTRSGIPPPARPYSLGLKRSMRISLALLFVFCGSMKSQPRQSLMFVPDILKPPSKEMLTLLAHADGDQVYACDGSRWMFSRPDAKLLTDSGTQIGSHFAGPTWESSDGSRVMAEPVAAATRPDSIPWLLLKSTNHQGEGVMKRVTSIQQLSTEGGRAELPANTLCKTRHSVPPFGIDVFEDILQGLILAEAEFDSASDADALAVPSFLIREVSDDDRFTGGQLASTSRPDLTAVLLEYGIRLL